MSGSIKKKQEARPCSESRYICLSACPERFCEMDSFRTEFYAAAPLTAMHCGNYDLMPHYANWGHVPTTQAGKPSVASTLMGVVRKKLKRGVNKMIQKIPMHHDPDEHDDDSQNTDSRAHVKNKDQIENQIKDIQDRQDEMEKRMESLIDQVSKLAEYSIHNQNRRSKLTNTQDNN